MPISASSPAIATSPSLPLNYSLLAWGCFSRFQLSHLAPTQPQIPSLANETKTNHRSFCCGAIDRVLNVLRRWGVILR